MRLSRPKSLHPTRPSRLKSLRPTKPSRLKSLRPTRPSRLKSLRYPTNSRSRTRQPRQNPPSLKSQFPLTTPALRKIRRRPMSRRRPNHQTRWANLRSPKEVSRPKSRHSPIPPCHFPNLASSIRSENLDRVSDLETGLVGFAAPKSVQVAAKIRRGQANRSVLRPGRQPAVAGLHREEAVAAADEPDTVDRAGTARRMRTLYSRAAAGAAGKVVPADTAARADKEESGASDLRFRKQGMRSRRRAVGAPRERFVRRERRTASRNRDSSEPSRCAEVRGRP